MKSRRARIIIIIIIIIIEHQSMEPSSIESETTSPLPPDKVDMGETSSPSEASNGGEVPKELPTPPTVVIVIGMAGAGKTTLMHRINLYLIEQEKRGYYINLDPAVQDVPFGANIDIRDTVDFKEVMKQYGLGPNGAILTSLNLFATRFDQVIGLLERRNGSLDYIFVDTPGQIEVFTWSAGGQIILDLLATTYPTIILYISDTPRCQNPTTFMSNMLYASSVLYKSQLPLLCVFNKIDILSSKFAKEWMSDFETFQDALDAARNEQRSSEEYMTSFNRSLSLAMEEFYRNIRAIGVSAVSSEGIEELFTAIGEARIEFQEVYLPDLLR
jgi:GPN-loop GTPase